MAEQVGPDQPQVGRQVQAAGRIEEEQRARERDRHAERADDHVLPGRLERAGPRLQPDQRRAGQGAGLDEDEQQAQVAGLERGQHERGEQTEEDEIQPDLKGRQPPGVLLGGQVGHRADRGEHGHRGHREQEEAAQ
jgi:hypothetical protein